MIPHPDAYSPGNLANVVPFLERPPAWLLLGGPADAWEAQAARELWPEVKVIGVEPNMQAVDWQLRHGWPKKATLLWGALSDRDGEVVTVSHDPASMRSSHTEPEGTAETRVTERVPAFTWDALDRVHGPFSDALLWMDIEGWELEAVQGAAGLLARGAFVLVNVEMQARVREKNVELDRMLTGAGYRAVYEWNASPACWDRVYVKRR